MQIEELMEKALNSNDINEQKECREKAIEIMKKNLQDDISILSSKEYEERQNAIDTMIKIHNYMSEIAENLKDN